MAVAARQMRFGREIDRGGRRFQFGDGCGLAAAARRERRLDAL